MYSVRYWSLGRMYVVPRLDEDTARSLYNMLAVTTMRCELWKGFERISTNIH